MASEVISIGRNRTRKPRDRFLQRFSVVMQCLTNSTMKMLFDTTMPTIITTPMSDITLSVVPVSNSTTITPVETRRNRQQDDERVQEGLKLRDQDQVYKNDRIESILDRNS